MGGIQGNLTEADTEEASGASAAKEIKTIYHKITPGMQGNFSVAEPKVTRLTAEGGRLFRWGGVAAAQSDKSPAPKSSRLLVLIINVCFGTHPARVFFA